MSGLGRSSGGFCGKGRCSAPRIYIYIYLHISIYIYIEGFERVGQSQSWGHRCGVTTEVPPGDGRSGPGQLILDHLFREEVNTGPWRMQGCEH